MTTSPSIPTPSVTVRSITPTPSGSPGPFGIGSNITIAPDHGPVGTRVHLEGDGFTGSYWQEVNVGGYGVFLDGRGPPPGCDLVALTTFTAAISPSGHLVAEFTVPVEGNCFQTTIHRPVSPGRYAVGVRCHVCFVAVFRVTSG